MRKRLNYSGPALLIAAAVSIIGQPVFASGGPVNVLAPAPGPGFKPYERPKVTAPAITRIFVESGAEDSSTNESDRADMPAVEDASGGDGSQPPTYRFWRILASVVGAGIFLIIMQRRRQRR